MRHGVHRRKTTRLFRVIKRKIAHKVFKFLEFRSALSDQLGIFRNAE